MNRLLTSALIVISSATASVGYGKDLRMVQKLRTAAQAGGAASFAKEKRLFAPQCANFSGNWEGTCIDDEGKSEHATLSVEQKDCYSLTMEGLEYPINGSISLQSAPSPDDEHKLAYTGTIAFAWNDSQTKLNSLVTVTLFGGVIGGAGNSALWLAGDQLRVKDDKSTPLLAIDGNTDFHAVLEDCTYSRVPHSK